MKKGAEAVFDTKKRVLTVAPTTDTVEIISMLVGALSIRNGVQLSKFIDKRGIAAANCIVSDAQA